jgi:hypothetical protein
MTDEDKNQIRAVLAQLRQLYTHLNNGTFNDSKSLARGLVSPQIKRLENLIDP